MQNEPAKGDSQCTKTTLAPSSNPLAPEISNQGKPKPERKVWITLSKSEALAAVGLLLGLIPIALAIAGRYDASYIKTLEAEKTTLSKELADARNISIPADYETVKKQVEGTNQRLESTKKELDETRIQLEAARKQLSILSDTVNNGQESVAFTKKMEEIQRQIDRANQRLKNSSAHNTTLGPERVSLSFSGLGTKYIDDIGVTFSEARFADAIFFIGDKRLFFDLGQQHEFITGDNKYTFRLTSFNQSSFPPSATMDVQRVPYSLDPYLRK